MILKAFKYEVHPTAEQRVMSHKIFGCVRFVYNCALNEKAREYRESQKNISCFDLTKQVAVLKKPNPVSVNQKLKNIIHTN